VIHRHRFGCVLGSFVRVLVVGSLVFLLFGCSTVSTTADAPATTTTSTFTHAQVLGWVTPTLSNGITILGSVPTDATAARITIAAQPLHAAASVSLSELSTVSWAGSLHPDEKELVKSLLQVKVAIAGPPGTASLERIDAAISHVQGALQELARRVDR